jgi:hypothetical protein
MDEIGYITTGNANLDLFCQLSRNINKNDLFYYLNQSWQLDKLKTIAIIFNSRDRLKGKKEKMISNVCLLWLKTHHLTFYKQNLLTYIEKYGCWNDLHYIINNTNNHNYEYKVFATQLMKDKELLENNENISLCAKWVFSPNNNKHCIKIARYLFDDITNYHEKYRKEYISPLRKHLDIIETKLCNNDWNNIDYSKIPSKALDFYKNSFIKNDNVNYAIYMKTIKDNKLFIKNTNLLPHEIIKKYIETSMHDIDSSLELQWQSYVNIYKNRNLDHIIPIVDGSGSMFIINKNTFIKPVYVSIALGLLFAEINSGFLHNKVMTFSNVPTFLTIVGNTLKDKITCISQAIFGLNTDFLKVADLIISTSLTDISFNYKKIICLTDMQFDKNNISIEDTRQLFFNKFINSNSIVPEVIYWNLNSSNNILSINNDYYNTSIISGFSQQLLSVVLDCDNITSEALMNKTIEPYYPNIII